MADFEDATTLERGRESAGSDVLRLGFMPLTDSAPLIVADALGFFARHGVSVSLSPLNAWVALRDRTAIGRLDGGQMLAPMPIAAALAGGLGAELRVVSVLSRQGNTITLGERLMAEVAEVAPEWAGVRPLPAAAMAAVIAARKASGRTMPKLAIVYPFSSHNYLLRHWLAQAGIDPERDVDLRAVPPPLVAGELAEGHIDGFCAGEPWGSRAVDLRAGEIALTTADIWPDHPEKVFAVSAACLARAPEQVERCVAALIEAGQWLSQPENRSEAARLLHLRAMPGVPQEVIARSLSSFLVYAPDEAPLAAPAMQFDATCPHPEHGAWWLQQMQLWQQMLREKQLWMQRELKPWLWMP
jgi:NitT/TauT family transport system ATP-binding protein/nitrate/nitrite transport system substrate-binding protein